MPFEVPVSLILGIVGAAVFIALLLRQRRLGAR
jgi:iron complex transport system permease protein